MKSNIISKEQAQKHKIEEFFNYLEDDTSSDFVERILTVPEQLTQEEQLKIETILELFFLKRNEKFELTRKFKDFFDEELKKEGKITSSQKFVDFLITKKIAGSKKQPKGHVADSSNEIEIKSLSISHSKESSEYPKVFRNEKGEILAIQVRCNCGEIINIELEFE
ncbi:MAG: hypothetical protein ACK42Z_03510 [Candidatus Kapaibacteriota bacterium]